MERNGTEVTDEDFTGPSGSIEAEVGKPPSNYHVACATLEPGTYKVGGFFFSFFSENSSANTSFSIRAGSQEEQVNFEMFPVLNAQTLFDQVSFVADVVVTDIGGQGDLLDFRFAINTLPLPDPPPPLDPFGDAGSGT